QYVAADDVGDRHRRRGDRLAVADRRVHAAPLGAELHQRPARERVLHHLGKESRIANRPALSVTHRRSDEAFALSAAGTTRTRSRTKIAKNLFLDDQEQTDFVAFGDLRDLRGSGE